MRKRNTNRSGFLPVSQSQFNHDDFKIYGEQSLFNLLASSSQSLIIDTGILFNLFPFRFVLKWAMLVLHAKLSYSWWMELPLAQIIILKNAPGNLVSSFPN